MLRHCPECGYDLGGLVDSWVDACPLSVTCSECGAELKSDMLVDQTKHQPNWSFEHGRKHHLKRLVLTLTRLICPSLFWKGLPSACRVHWLRLIVFVALTVGVSVAWICSLSGRSEFQNQTHDFYMMRPRVIPFETRAQLTAVVLASLWPKEYFVNVLNVLFGWGTIVVAGSILMPLPLLVFRTTLGSRIGAYTALARGWCYQTGMLSLAIALLMWRHWSTTRSYWTGEPDWNIIWFRGWWSLFNRTVIVGLFVWSVLYWYSFIRHQMKFQYPGLVTFYALIVGFGTATFFALHVESDIPRIELGLFLTDVFGQPPPGE